VNVAINYRKNQTEQLPQEQGQSGRHCFDSVLLGCSLRVQLYQIAFFVYGLSVLICLAVFQLNTFVADGADW
jgi:hypothetical protein